MTISFAMSLLHSTEKSGNAHNIKKNVLAFCLIDINYYCTAIKMEDTSAIIQGNFSPIT